MSARCNADAELTLGSWKWKWNLTSCTQHRV